MPESEIYVDKLAYAQALLDGAKRILQTGTNEPISNFGIPFHLLIGFSIENILKAHLAFNNCSEKGWNKSHDLSNLLQLAKKFEIPLDQGVEKMVDLYSPMHEQHWFRYPEQAGVANVYSGLSTLVGVEQLLRRVFEVTKTASKLA